jgi:ubiquinone/menaquinone biosynthesis C-methylase UbiE
MRNASQLPSLLAESSCKKQGTTMPTDVLWCLEHGAELRCADGRLICQAGHAIAVERGVPVFAERPRREPRPLNMQRLPPRAAPGMVDEFVDDWIVNTNGNLYWRARGRLRRYPIPRWPARRPNGRGETLVDIGCSWGRWTVGAARAGYAVWGVDVHLDALWAAGRVTRELGVTADFACCDAAQLPFKPASVDFVFSYSVLQHLEKQVVREVLKEIARILRPRGTCFIQLPSAVGVASLLRQARRGFREARLGTFEMRYWTREEIRRAFREAGFGGVRFSAEGFLLQNTQPEDIDLLSKAGAAAVRGSCWLRDAANRVPVLGRLADSVWIEAAKE